VGVSVGGEPGVVTPLAMDASAIADGLAAWAAEGIGHVQLALDPVEPATLDVVLDAVRRFRGQFRQRAPRAPET
jgi:hypothetical protein